jgi:hypothetical protein
MTDNRTKQAEQVARVVFDKHHEALFDSIAAEFGRCPTEQELSVAGLAFMIGAVAAAAVVIERYDELNTARNWGTQTHVAGWDRRSWAVCGGYGRRRVLSGVSERALGFVPWNLASVTENFLCTVTENKRWKVTKDFMATTGQLAEILGVSEELIRALSRQKVIPKNGRNEFDLRESIPAFYARNAVDEDSLSEYEKERTRYMKARADQAEMQTALQAGDIGYISEIHAVYQDEILQLRGEVLWSGPVSVDKKRANLS